MRLPTIVETILFFIWIIKGRGEECRGTQVKSACTENCGLEPNCVESMAMLVGGSSLSGWRSDGEVVSAGGDFHRQISDFPYTIDAPYGFWGGGKLGVVVCGGKNWDDDVIEQRCWRYDPCTDGWQVGPPDMPVGSSGGIGVGVPSGSGDSCLHVLGGGNGTALDHTQILCGTTSEITDEVEWSWRMGPKLNEARYGHCAIYHKKDELIYVAGGRDDAGILRTVEVIRPTADQSTAQTLVGVETPRDRWGGLCEYLDDPATDISEPIMFSGGMDINFFPHNNVDFFYPGLDSEEGSQLPWASAGAIGVPLGGQYTLMGGFSLLGFKNGIISGYGLDGWEEWTEGMVASRVSGLALAVPVDLFDYC